MITAYLSENCAEINERYGANSSKTLETRLKDRYGTNTTARAIIDLTSTPDDLASQFYLDVQCDTATLAPSILVMSIVVPAGESAAEYVEFLRRLLDAVTTIDKHGVRRFARTERIRAGSGQPGALDATVESHMRTHEREEHQKTSKKKKKRGEGEGPGQRQPGDEQLTRH